MASKSNTALVSFSMPIPALDALRELITRDYQNDITRLTIAKNNAKLTLNDLMPIYQEIEQHERDRTLLFNVLGIAPQLPIQS